MEFYYSVLGGELKVSTFGEGNPAAAEDEKNLVMHAVIENGPLTLMASDGGKQHELKVGNNVSLSISGDDEEALTKYFNGLSDGGTVTMPLAKAHWGDTFGMFKDKFGIDWLINISAGQQNPDQK